MRRLRGRLVPLVDLAILLIVGSGVLICNNYLLLWQNIKDQPPATTNSVEANPHASLARHPLEVIRILELLPEIRPTASFDEIIAMLGLSKDWNGGSVGSKHCSMSWDVAPGYRFNLLLGPEYQGDKTVFVLVEAGFTAQSKPGIGFHEDYTVYPYRTRKGMVYQ